MTNGAERPSPAQPRASHPTSAVMRGNGTDCRVRDWPHEPTTAQLVLYPQARLPSVHDLDRWCGQLAADGYSRVRTSALATVAAVRVESAGFGPVQELVLLQHDEPRGITAPAFATQRLLVDHYARAAGIDEAAFTGEWSLDAQAIADVCSATPRHRGRTVAIEPGGEFCAYAITGRDSRQGFLQRLAVDPAHQRLGLGRALVLDSLRWLARWRVQRVLVNTPVHNLAALALYERTGFVRLPDRLTVYERALS